jgi:hypothetical protein
VASLAGEVARDGSIAGRATSDGRALGDRVDVQHGGVSGSSRIDGSDGSWRVAPGPDARGAGMGTVSWSGATVAASFRTVTELTAAGAAPDGAPGPAAGAGARPGGHGRPGARPPAGAGSRSAACARKHWLAGSARAPKLLLIGLSRPQLEGCLGHPGARTAARGSEPERWRYGRGLVVTLRAGRVSGYVLTSRTFRSAHGAVGIGSPARRLKALLPALRRDPRTGDDRAAVGLGRRRTADVRVGVDGRGRIARIQVTSRRAT